jgi:hypothetical protein
VLALRDSGEFDSQGSEWSWGTDLTIGALALLFAVALATRADQRLRERRRARKERRTARHGEPPADADREPWSQRILAKGSVPIVLVASIALNLPGAAYVVALKDIAVAGHTVLGDVVWILGFNLIMFVLAEIPWLGLVFAPDRTDALVKRMESFLVANGRKIAIGLCVILGVYLVVRGVIHAG